MMKIRNLLYLLGMILISTASSVKTDNKAPKAAILLTQGFHGEETYIPMGYLVNKGVDITVIGPEKGRVLSWDKIYSIDIEKTIKEVSLDDFDVLIIPGGSAPAKMREIPEAVNFTIDFYNSGKTVASICHGPQLLTVTGILDGANATGVSDIQDELEAAGAIYINEAVVVHKNLITSRDPDDIPSFIIAIEEALLKSK